MESHTAESLMVTECPTVAGAHNSVADSCCSVRTSLPLHLFTVCDKLSHPQKILFILFILFISVLFSKLSPLMMEDCRKIVSLLLFLPHQFPHHVIHNVAKILLVNIQLLHGSIVYGV